MHRLRSAARAWDPSRQHLKALRLVWAVFLQAAFCLTSAAQMVTLPLERYEQLRHQALPEPDPSPPMPVAFEEVALTITTGEVMSGGGINARVTQELTVTILDDGWQSLSVGDAGTVIDADFGTAEGRLNTAPVAGGTTIALRGVGRHRLRLTSVVPLALDETVTRPTWRLRLKAARAALVHGVVQTSHGIEKIEAAGAMVDAGDGEGAWRLVAEPGAEVKLTFHGASQVPEKQSLPLAFEATSALALEVARGRQRASVWLEARVRQGALERLAARVPDDFEVIDVIGDAIAGWDVSDGLLAITPLAPVTGSMSLEVELAAGAATELASPVLIPGGAASVLAATKVHVSGDGWLQLLDAGSGRRPDGHEESGLPPAFRSAPGMALVLPSAGSRARWQVTWPEGVEVLAAQVDRLLVDVLVGSSGRAGYQCWAEVRNRGSERLLVELPAGAELIGARRDGRRIEPGRQPGSGTWTVPLRVGDGRQVIQLSGLLPLELPDAGRFEVPLPVLSAPIGRVEVSVFLPGGHRYELLDSARHGVVDAPPMPLAIDSEGAGWSLDGPAGGPALVGAAAESLPGFFAQPPGFRRVVAAWSVLSTSPAPLEIRRTNDSDKRGWF